MIGKIINALKCAVVTAVCVSSLIGVFFGGLWGIVLAAIAMITMYYAVCEFNWQL